VERDQKHIIFIRYYTLKSKNSELRSSPFVPLPKFWCINVQLMSPILEICSFLSFILFNAIVIDISILFRKWRGSQLKSNNTRIQPHLITMSLSDTTSYNMFKNIHTHCIVIKLKLKTNKI